MRLPSLLTRSRRRQNLVRLAWAVALLVIYAVMVKVLGLGNAGCFWGVAQMRVFLPALVLFGILAYETRWDGISRKKEDETEDEAKATPSIVQVSSPSPRKDDNVRSTTTTQNYNSSTIVQVPSPSPRKEDNFHSTTTTSNYNSPEEAWKAARAMPHNVVPNPVTERDYYALVVQAANGGCLEALLKLSDYARQRGANVEAYYWTAMAQKRGAKGLDGRMGEIRKQWLFNEANGEYENVYEFFPETCGTIARSLLRIACSIDAPYARKRLRDLAALGDVNAKLFC